jgi:hypothetical protein
MNWRIGTAVFGLLATLAVPLFVKAGMENMPGSMCVGTNAALTVTSTGNADNGNAAAVTAICPTERVTIGGSLALNFSGRVWVLDRNSNADVCCHVVSRNPSSGTVTAGTDVCSTGNSTSAQSLTLPGINDPYTFSSFYIQCTMPAVGSGPSRIVTYRAIES